MKQALCTLTICLAIFGSIVTTRSLLRTEGRRLRQVLSNAVKDPEGLIAKQTALLQRLDTLNTQLAALNRRIELLESDPAERASIGDTPRIPSLDSAFNRQMDQVSRSLDNLSRIPMLLTDLTTYLDHSFEHLEESVALTAPPADIEAQLTVLEEKLGDIDSYFTPLYAFLGLVYDPQNEDLLKTYPTLDLRVNALAEEVAAARKDIGDLRIWLGPRTREFPPSR